MPDRTAIVVSAVFASFLAGVALTAVSGAARAGNDCLTEPKDQPPQGSHWYYHVDQVTHHKCWHRRAEGLTIHQVGSSKPYPPAKPILQQGAEVDRQEPTADSRTEQPIVGVQSTTAGLTGQSTPETSTDAAGGENPPPSILSSRWPDPQSRGELDQERELAHSAAADAGIDSQGTMPPVFTRDQVAAAERPPESSTDRMRLAVLGALALTVATGGLVFKYSAARRLRRADILDQRGSASTRQADVICDLPEPRELSCATEELRRHLVQLVEYGTFSRWPPIPPRNVDPSFSYSPGGASGPLGRNQRQEVRYRHVRQRASQ